MKNLKYFPFERNRYFYGKLLTVDDFELEQKYMNDKRRMINRFLYGTGVVSGMQVVCVDDTTISVEMGLALDFSGREIVIEAPITKKLSMLNGFESYKESEKDYGYLYLCIDYDEIEKGLAHNIAGSNSFENDSGEYNKYIETYKLYLTSEEPKDGLTNAVSLHEDKKTIYWGNGIRIKQIMPKYTRAGKTFDLKIEIENMGQQQSFAFSYELVLTCLKYMNQSRLKVSFDERLFEKSGRYEISYALDALSVENTEGLAIIESDSFRMSVANKEVKASAKGTISTYIVKGDVKKALIDEYYKMPLEKIAKTNYQQTIYLAKINLTKAGSSYVINQIENKPFKQLVLNNALDLAIEQILINDMEEIKAMKSNSMVSDIDINQNSDKSFKLYEPEVKMAKGEVRLDIDSYAKRGQRFYTGEITHGLGLGEVTIILAMEEISNVKIYGSCEVFPDIEPLAELGAKTNEEKGTFIIGARLLASTTQQYIRIHWTAFSNTLSVLDEKNDKRIFIKPTSLNLLIKESYYLEAICSNMNDTRLKWIVNENGGFIDKNGMYTAPDKAGVYEVVVESVAYSNVKASIFVVVRES